MTELGFTLRLCDPKPWTQLTYSIADFLDDSKVSFKVEIPKTALLPLAVLPAMPHLQGLLPSSHTLKGPQNLSALCCIRWQCRNWLWAPSASIWQLFESAKFLSNANRLSHPRSICWVFIHLFSFISVLSNRAFLFQLLLHSSVIW